MRSPIGTSVLGAALLVIATGCAPIDRPPEKSASPPASPKSAIPAKRPKQRNLNYPLYTGRVHVVCGIPSKEPPRIGSPSAVDTLRFWLSKTTVFELMLGGSVDERGGADLQVAIFSPDEYFDALAPLESLVDVAIERGDVVCTVNRAFCAMKGHAGSEQGCYVGAGSTHAEALEDLKHY